MRRAAKLSIALPPAFLLAALAPVRAAAPLGEPTPSAPRAQRAGAAFGPEAQARSEVLRRREVEDLRRQDLAAALGRLGEPVRWQDHSIRELSECRARVEAAEALRTELGVTVDWHKLTLEQLLDLRVRGAKGAELANGFGIAIDWQRYSWVELEALLRTLRRMGPRPSPADGGAPAGQSVAAAAGGKPSPAPALLAPTFSGRPDRRRPGMDPDAVIAPTFVPRPGARGSERDPDAVIRPRFASRPAAPVDARDPDAVLRPRFAGRPVVHTGEGPDDLISPTFAETQRRASEAAFSPAVDDPDDLIDPQLPPR